MYLENTLKLSFLLSTVYLTYKTVRKVNKTAETKVLERYY